MIAQLGDTLSSLFEVLKLSGARVALVGGVAVSMRAEPRFTRDVDLVVAVADDRSAEALVASSGCGRFTSPARRRVER